MNDELLFSESDLKYLVSLHILKTFLSGTLVGFLIGYMIFSAVHMAT